jgi:MFS family permease
VPPVDPFHRHVRALAHLSGFRRLLTVRLTSQYGDGLFQAALAGSVLFNPAQETNSVKIAVGFAVLLIPYSILGPYVGVFLDRWSRRDIIYLANLVRGALAVVAAALIAIGGLSLEFFVCALLITAINRFFLAGLSAAAPHVVPEPLLVTNNAVASTLGTVAYSLGLGTTAVILHTALTTNNHGYAALAGAGAACYLAASTLAHRSFARMELGPDVAVPRTVSIPREIAAAARGMVAGAHHLVDRPPVAYAMAVQALCRTLFGVLTLAILLLYSHYFYSSYSSAIGGLGQIVVVGSIGAIAAAFITPYATRHLGGRGWVFAMTLLLALALPPLALPFVPALLVLSTFLGNISSQGIKIVVDTNVQVHCDEDFHGRVFSLEDTLFNFMFVVGLFIGALTLPDNGHSVGAVVAVSAGYLVLAVSYAWLTRRQPPLEAHPAAKVIASSVA